MESKKQKGFNQKSSKKALLDFDVVYYFLDRYTNDDLFYEYYEKNNINISQAVRHKIIQYINDNAKSLRQNYSKTTKQKFKDTNADFQTILNRRNKAKKYAEELINKKLEEFVNQEKTEIQHQNDAINTNILLKLYDPSRKEESRFKDFFDKLPENSKKNNINSITYEQDKKANKFFQK